MVAAVAAVGNRTIRAQGCSALNCIDLQVSTLTPENYGLIGQNERGININVLNQSETLLEEE